MLIFQKKCLDACHSGIFLLSGRKYLLIFRDKCFTIYIKVGVSGAKGWKVDKVDNFVDNQSTVLIERKAGVFNGTRI